MKPLTDEELALVKAELLKPASAFDESDKKTARDIQRFVLGVFITAGLGLLFVGLCLALVVLAFKAVLG